MKVLSDGRKNLMSSSSVGLSSAWSSNKCNRRYGSIVLVTWMFPWSCHGFQIPATPAEQTQRAVQSIRRAMEDGRRRLFVDYLLPLPPETDAADIDPWPGGLAQMVPYAEDVVAEILRGAVPGGPATQSRSQVLSVQDCCTARIQESLASPSDDMVAVLFPGVDQLDKLEEIEAMVRGGSSNQDEENRRTVLLVNRQFRRPEDFGGFFGGDRQRSRDLVFDRYEWGFAFQELGCRGEDVKLTYEYPEGWTATVVCSENTDEEAVELSLFTGLSERPSYEALEAKLNEVLPEPLWMRKMGEVESKGFKFQR